MTTTVKIPNVGDGATIHVGSDRYGCTIIARLTRERDAARAAIRDASRCENCGAWATRYHTASASFCCDSCGVGDGWADDTHAAALRAAMRAP